MRRLRRIIFVVAALALTTGGRMAMAQDFIDPTVDLTLPTINFDTNINPVSGSLSNDALNILRAHRVAMQQVQAALQYLRVHRFEIMEGKNAWYNQVFGDFYDANSSFSGLYNRTQNVGIVDQFGQPVLDRFGHQLTQEQFNTAHFDRIFNVFLRIQNALNDDTTYSWGAQPGNVANQTIFDAYRTATPMLGDPLFGNPQISSTADTGTRQWGYSTSFTPTHLAQIAATPNAPLRWDQDNAVGGTLTPAQELAFFKDRLDSYSVSSTTTTTVGGVTTTTNNIDTYVGGAFLNELMRSDSTNVGEPNPFFHPTELKQYQQLIAALAQSEGSLGYDIVTVETITVTTTTQGSKTTITNTDRIVSGITLDSSAYTPGTVTATTTTNNSSGSGNSQSGSSNQNSTTTTTTTTITTITSEAVAIEPGLVDLFGQNAYFMAALDSKSYALFADLFKPVTEGGVGDGTLLPPPGKQGTHSDTFFPVVPGS